MTVVLEALFCQTGNLLLRVPPSTDGPDVFFHIFPEPSENEENEMVSKRSKESMERSWNQ